MTNMESIRGDITKQRVDAIVNAANSGLLPGGGVCGAIYAASGPGLKRETDKIGHCPTGFCVVTPSHATNYRSIIHAVAPIAGTVSDEALKTAMLLCYSNILSAACAIGAKTLAIPCIGTGIYGVDNSVAASIAVNVCEMFGEFAEKITFVCHTSLDYSIYQELLA